MPLEHIKARILLGKAAVVQVVAAHAPQACSPVPLHPPIPGLHVDFPHFRLGPLHTCIALGLMCLQRAVLLASDVTTFTSELFA